MTKIDKTIKILQAFKEGKTIEFLAPYDSNYWREFTDEINTLLGMLGNPDFDLRIKPEQKLRPYKNAEKFLQASKEHGPYLKVKLSHGNNFYISVNVSDQGVVLYKCDPRWNSVEQHNEQIDFDNVKLCYVWQDGTPCGILEE